jgi:hypothetical protein
MATSTREVTGTASTRGGRDLYNPKMLWSVFVALLFWQSDVGSNAVKDFAEWRRPGLNSAPNTFLTKVVSGVRPGRALEIGVGHGRNAIFLAKQRWDATGFDVADKA